MIIQKTEDLPWALQNFSSTKEIDEPDLREIFEHVLLANSKKIDSCRRHTEKNGFTPPLIKHTNQQLSPRKILQMTRKLLKTDDAENKKIGEENKKKKPSDTALKKMSNIKIEGENNSSPGYKKILRDLRETKEREDLFKTAVTVKRMRTISKKKLN